MPLVSSNGKTMIEKINESELEFMEDFYNPVVLAECLFSDLDNLAVFDKSYSNIRLGQVPLLSFEYLLDYDKSLSDDKDKCDKMNFKLREGSGNLWCLGGRKFGKTLIAEIVDTLVSMVLLSGEYVGFTSLDHLHIRSILEKIIIALENHPFMKMFNAKINRSPSYRIRLKNNYLLESVNMNLTGKNPGAQFFQKHFNRMIIEEASFETREIYGKRLDSVAENGCVIRAAGMTNFTKVSPCGRIFYDLTRRPWLLNLPQYINPKWDEKEKVKAIKEHGGESSIGFRVFVKGDVVEEGISVLDMERVRRCYDYEKRIKHIEISKDSFHNYKDLLIVERPENAEVLYIDADIGESAPTEIVVHSKVNDIYKYLYNITLYNLTDKQQTEIFLYLAKKLSANFIGLDTTDGMGRAIFRSLEQKLGRERLVWCSFNEKINVDFAKDENNNYIYKDGRPVYKEEFISEWSVKRLKDLFYNLSMNVPLDYKLDVQLNSIIAMQSGSRTVYKCDSEEDHLLAAFRVFAITEWNNRFILTPVSNKVFSKSGV